MMNRLTNLEQFVLAATREELKKDLLILRRILANSDMIDCILAPFEEILSSDRISLHRLYYMRELSRCLQQLAPACTDEQVEEVLLFMNFNSKRYLKYKLKLFSDTIRKIPSVHRQLAKAKWLLKMNKQQQECAGFQFNRRYPSLKAQMSEWLELECEYLEHKVCYPENVELPEEVARWQFFKVKMNMSVSELAFLLRVMMEYGLIQHSNKSEVVDFFSRYFSTNNQPVISADSLRRKIYTYDRSSVAAVKQLLLDLFHKSKQVVAD